MEVILPVS